MQGQAVASSADMAHVRASGTEQSCLDGLCPLSAAPGWLQCPARVTGQWAASVAEAAEPRWPGTECAAGRALLPQLYPSVLRGALGRVPRDFAAKGQEKERGEPRWPELILSSEGGVCGGLTQSEPHHSDEKAKAWGTQHLGSSIWTLGRPGMKSCCVSWARAISGHKQSLRVKSSSKERYL